jgi:hypothetical protein
MLEVVPRLRGYDILEITPPAPPPPAVFPPPPPPPPTAMYLVVESVPDPVVDKVIVLPVVRKL